VPDGRGQLPGRHLGPPAAVLQQAGLKATCWQGGQRKSAQYFATCARSWRPLGGSRPRQASGASVAKRLESLAACAREWVQPRETARGTDPAGGFSQAIQLPVSAWIRVAAASGGDALPGGCQSPQGDWRRTEVNALLAIGRHALLGACPVRVALEPSASVRRADGRRAEVPAGPRTRRAGATTRVPQCRSVAPSEAGIVARSNGANLRGFKPCKFVTMRCCACVCAPSRALVSEVDLQLDVHRR
jgi:hypothetical protein